MSAVLARVRQGDCIHHLGHWWQVGYYDWTGRPTKRCRWCGKVVKEPQS